MCKCVECGIPLSPIEVSDGELCLRCEVISLRKFKRKHDEQLMRLVGGPVWNKYVERSQIHSNGCVLNLT